MAGPFYGSDDAWTPFRHDPTLLKLAGYAVGDFGKSAIVPAGGPPPDPSGGMGGPPPGDPSAGGAPPPDPSAGAPPPDPSAGGASPPPGGGMDPNAMQAIVQQVIQAIGAGGGGGAGGAMGPNGKPPKKAEDAIRDAKIYTIDVKLTAICDHLGITLPASVTLGNPPDPQSQQSAQQEHQQASMVASDPNASAAPPGPQNGIGPVPAMDPSQGPIGGKAASYFGERYPATLPFDVFDDEPAPSSQAARYRGLLGA